MLDEAFWTIHSGLPRQGPGNRDSTLRALALMTELPAAPAILDVGCGPGMQTLDLAAATRGAITAVDTHREFLNELQRRAAAAGFADRIATVKASMTALPFSERSFDAVWCEGAIYLMGFPQGLAAWKPLLKLRGYLAVTEPCWLKPTDEIPVAVRREWAEAYPAMTSIEATAAMIAQSGYRETGHFVLPEAAWWDDYYRPLEARLAPLRERHGHDPNFRDRVDEAQAEINAYRAYAEVCGYVFFVMRAT